MNRQATHEIESPKILTREVEAIVREELANLLQAHFDPQAGFLREGRQIVVSGKLRSSEDPSTIDFEVAIRLRRKADPSSSKGVFSSFARADRAMLEECLSMLNDEREELRASACRRLGQSGFRTAESKLRERAEKDPDAAVRAIAAEALELLPLRHLPADAVHDLPVRLFVQTSERRFAHATERTDRQGRVRFAALPKAESCQLLLIREPSFEFEGRTIRRRSRDDQRLFFNTKHSVSGHAGGWDMFISPLQIEDSDVFSAELTVIGTDQEWEGCVQRHPGKPIVSAFLQNGCHLYFATECDERTGRAVFEQLPTGRYEVLLHEESTMPQEDYTLCADTVPLSSEDSSEQWQDAVIVHPRDQRLLATLESDGEGHVIVAVETEASELEGYTVELRLHDEIVSGQLQRETPHHASRTVFYLEQRIRPDSALSLHLEVKGNTIPA